MPTNDLFLTLFVILPLGCIVLSIVALALAGDPPALARSQRLRTLKLLGASLLPLPLVVLSHVVVPNRGRSAYESMFRFDLEGLLYLLIEASMVVVPTLLAATWFRKVAPTRTIYNVMTIVAVGFGVWFALADFFARALSGL